MAPATEYVPAVVAVSVTTIVNELPFVQLLGIEIEEACDGHAAGRLELDADHYSAPGVAHGGVPYALADTVGGAAVISLHHQPTPTVDMRIDYHAPARDDLLADAEVVRDGGSIASADVRIEQPDGTHVASARGTFKTGGGEADNPWAIDH